MNCNLENYGLVTCGALVPWRPHTQDGGCRFLQNVGTYLWNYRESHCKRP